MAFALQRLTLDDVDAAARVLRASFDDRLPWLRGLHTPDEDRAFFRLHVFPTCAVWGAIDAGIVGLAAFRPGWLDQLYVEPGHQGRGVGSALLGIAKAEHPTLLLWTFRRNHAARHFYEARGFVAVDETDGSANEEREPDVLYRWTRGDDRASASSGPFQQVSGA